jgi:hypothetical protein
VTSREPTTSAATLEIQGSLPLVNGSNQHPSSAPVRIEELTAFAIKSGFPPEKIGNDILRLSEESDGIEKVIAYAAILAKARIARSKRNGAGSH